MGSFARNSIKAQELAVEAKVQLSAKWAELSVWARDVAAVKMKETFDETRKQAGEFASQKQVELRKLCEIVLERTYFYAQVVSADFRFRVAVAFVLCALQIHWLRSLRRYLAPAQLRAASSSRAS